MARRLAVVLEAYALKCLDLIQNNDMAELQEDGPGCSSELPELPSYPDDVDG
jgi:hypothetical protein